MMYDLQIQSKTLEYVVARAKPEATPSNGRLLPEGRNDIRNGE